MTCAAPGCIARPRSPGSIYCEKHYTRLRRRGSLDLVGASPVLRHTHGYRLVHAPDHPLCTDGQVHVYEHRKVFYDAHGEGPFSCHVCGAVQGWATMHVDHLNDDPADNRLENLAPACPVCNRKRGLPVMRTTQRLKGRHITVRGVSLCLSEWSRCCGVPITTLRRRLRDGWDAATAVDTPPGPTGPKRPGGARILGGLGGPDHTRSHAENFSPAVGILAVSLGKPENG